MSLRACPPPREEAEPIVELIEQFADAKRIDARRGELDRKCEAVEPPADLGGDRRIRIAQAERLESVGRAVDEELNCREREGFVRLETRRERRHAQPRQPADTLPFHSKRFSAGREDLHARSICQDAIRAGSHGIDDVLAAVEHKQHLAVAQKSAQRSKHACGIRRQANCRGNGVRDESRVLQWRQVDEPHAISGQPDRVFGDGKGNRRLTDAAGPDDRYEPGFIQFPPDRGDRILSPDDAGRCGRQIVIVR